MTSHIGMTTLDLKCLVKIIIAIFKFSECLIEIYCRDKITSDGKDIQEYHLEKSQFSETLIKLGDVFFCQNKL